MIHRAVLLSDLQKLLQKLEADLLERSESTEVPEVGGQLRAGVRGGEEADRTAQSFEEWRSDAITQAAAAWVLSCVFVRFLEDNPLSTRPKIAGPGETAAAGPGRARAVLSLAPHADRPRLPARCLRRADEACRRPRTSSASTTRSATSRTGSAATRPGTCSRFFQKIDPNTGALVHDFTDPDWDTRFLGDLYQDLSEAARKKYALLQTPVFVEEFILDRTLDPAIEEFGLAKMGYETRL